MAEDVDYAHLPTGQFGWRSLAEQLSRLDPRAERHFLEIKSHIDLDSTEGRAKVAKFILGAANRDPVEAAERFDGCALMVLGVEQGSLPGIPAFEAFDLQQAVRAFTGDPGPRWDHERITVEGGNIVVVIIVEPPDPGQQPWFCCRDGAANLRNGRIFIRDDGSTREAKAAEAQAMVARREMAQKPQVDLAVRVKGAIRRYKYDGAVLEAYLERECRRLWSAFPQPKPGSAGSGLDDLGLTMSELTARMLDAQARASSLGGTIPDRRTREDYAEEITAWVSTVRKKIDSLLDRAAGYVWPGITLEIENLADTYLEEPSFSIHISGDVEALRKERIPVRAASAMPQPPREWGPMSVLEQFGSSSIHSAFRVPVPQAPPPTGHANFGVARFTNGGSVDLELPLAELRPQQTVKAAQSFVLVAREHGLTGFHGTWQATAKGLHALYRGQVPIPVASEVTDLSDWLAHELGVDRNAS